jgi:ADP-ribose pyrophosphatase YjhB (NUDIX family)
MFETNSGIIKPIVYVGIKNKNRILLVQYKESPNPSKSGWWIPAPSLEFGEDPKEIAENICKEFGFDTTDLKLFDVESFVLPGGSHIITHYNVNVTSEPKPHPNIKEYQWVTSEQLSQMKDIAHGKWEIGVGKSYLGAD